LKKCVFSMLIASPLAWAQAPTPAAADPSDPTAAVPRVAYRSVFADTPIGVEAELADWKRANAEVGQFRRGHVDLLKWEQERAYSTPAPVTGDPRHHGGHKP
jgi:hypothetical protein